MCQQLGLKIECIMPKGASSSELPTAELLPDQNEMQMHDFWIMASAQCTCLIIVPYADVKQSAGAAAANESLRYRHIRPWPFPDSHIIRERRVVLSQHALPDLRLSAHGRIQPGKDNIEVEN